LVLVKKKNANTKFKPKPRAPSSSTFSNIKYATATILKYHLNQEFCNVVWSPMLHSCRTWTTSSSGSDRFESHLLWQYIRKINVVCDVSATITDCLCNCFSVQSLWEHYTAFHSNGQYIYVQLLHQSCSKIPIFS